MRFSVFSLGFALFSLSAIAQIAPPDSVAIGYGKRSAANIVGAQKEVSASDFNKGLINSPAQLLAGKVSGLLVTPVDGAPGAANQLRIRQGASIANSGAPLVVLDGVPLWSESLLGVDDLFSFINTEDIASITVLQEAAATAIYGSRGTDGVLLINTKKGDAGDKFHLTLSTQGALATASEKADVLSADEFRAAVLKYGTASQQALLGSANTDWQDEIQRTAFSHDNNLSVSGALGQTPYRLSLGYLNQNGVIKSTGLNRTSAALSLSPSMLHKHLKLNLDLRTVAVNSRFASPGALVSAALFDPTQPVWEKNRFGDYYTYLDANGNPNYLAPQNPLSLLEQLEDKGASRRNIASLSLDYAFHFLPALHANVNAAYDRADNKRSLNAPANMARYALQGGIQEERKQTVENRLLEFYLNYGHDIASLRSRLDATAGVSEQAYKSEFKSENSKNSRSVTYKAYFGRLQYTYANQLEFTGTLRSDGSSQFSEDNRQFVSKAIGLAWNMAEASFIKETSVLSELKWRASYGITGNMDVNVGIKGSAYEFGSGGNGRPLGYLADLKPESIESWNFGFDAGLLQNRVRANVDFYNRTTSDLILMVGVPGGTNMGNSILINSGSYKTKGLELALESTVLQKEDLSWSVGVNSTWNRNEILEFGEQNAGYTFGSATVGYGNNIQIHKPGYSASSFYVYKQIYTPSGTPIESSYADMGKDGKLTGQDRYVNQSATPKAFWGLSSDLRYKHLSFSFLLRGQSGNYMFNNAAAANGSYASMFYGNGYLRNASASVQETGFMRSQPLSDYYVEDASFLRMEYLSLGYDFGKLGGGKTSLRATAAVQNAFTFTKYSGQSPEVAGGIDYYTYPQPRTYSLGLRLNI